MTGLPVYSSNVYPPSYEKATFWVCSSGVLRVLNISVYLIIL